MHFVALGSANIVGSLSEPKKFPLSFVGIHGDKKLGMRQLKLVANGGHYLRPFAKILPALAASREKDPDVAKANLEVSGIEKSCTYCLLFNQILTARPVSLCVIF